MKYKKRTLPNGLRVITAPLKETKAVTLLIMFKVGSRFEDKPANGVSHLIEHLTFKGTKKRPNSLTISKELDSIGAIYNAMTAKDYTGYYIKATQEHLPLALDMLSDILFDSKFEKKELELERGVILEEMKMYEDDRPAIYVAELFDTLLYGNTPLGRLIIGTRQSLGKLDRDQVIKYRERFYQPDNMVICAAGNFSEKSFKDLLKKYFSNLKNRVDIKSFEKNLDQQKKPQVLLYRKKTEQAHMVLGTRAYSYHQEEDLYPLILLSTILGGGMSSRLFIKIRERNGLCYYIKSDVDTFEDTGAFSVHAGLNKGKIDFVIKEILKEFKRVKTSGVTAEELRRVKNQIKGNLFLGLEDSENIAAWFTKQELLERKTLTPEEKIRKIEKVNLRQIKRVANELFKTEKLNLALIGPFSDKNRFQSLLKI